MTGKIVVLHIIKSLGRGGAEMLLPETLKLHNQTQFEFHYIYFLPWKNQMAEAIEAKGGRVMCVPASNNLRILLKYRSIIDYCKKNNVRLIHCHLPWAGFAGRLVHRLTRIPVVYTEHNKQERYHFATRLINRLTFNWQNAVVAVSKDVSDSIKKGISVRIPLHEVLNGVNTEYFQRNDEAGKQLRKNLDIPEDAFVVGTIAVFRFQKRLKEWLDVFARLSASHKNVYGLLVGDGPLKEELVQQISVLGLTSKVKMPGLQTNVKPWLSAMNVFMMSSVFEGLPIALLEAMSMECAIVTTDAGGIKEVIHNEVNGLMVSAEKWEQLEGEVMRLIEDQEFASRLSKAARIRVKEKFGMERMVNQLEELYKQTLDS